MKDLILSILVVVAAVAIAIGICWAAWALFVAFVVEPFLKLFYIFAVGAALS